MPLYLGDKQIDIPYDEAYLGNILKYQARPFSARFITVGTDDGTRYSLDGYNWFEMTGINSSHTLQAIAYGNNRLVAVGNDGKSYYSLDGETWIAMSGLPSTYNFYDVAFGNDRFIAVGEEGRSYYSIDGETWVRFTGLNTSHTYISIIFVEDRFIVVGEGGKSYYSLDGESWIEMSGLPSTYYGNDLLYVDGVIYCTVSNETIYKTTDKLTWTKVSDLPLNTARNFAYGNGMYIISTLGATTLERILVAYSTNLIDWTQYSIELDNAIKSAEKIVFAKDRFLMVGDSGFFAYSFDGLTWVENSIGTRTTVMNDAIYV